MGPDLSSNPYKAYTQLIWWYERKRGFNFKNQ